MAGEAHSPAVCVRIEGRVQGVWYRGWCVNEATALELRGWVRNRHDGTVEALLSGPAAAIKDMIAACHEGPRAANVERVSVETATDDGSHRFEARDTA